MVQVMAVKQKQDLRTIAAAVIATHDVAYGEYFQGLSLHDNERVCYETMRAYVIGLPIVEARDLLASPRTIQGMSVLFPSLV